MNLYSLADSFYFLSKFAGLLKCPEAMAKEIIEFAISNNAKHSVDYLTAILKTYENELIFREIVFSEKYLGRRNKNNDKDENKQRDENKLEELKRIVTSLKKRIEFISKDIKGNIGSDYKFLNPLLIEEAKRRGEEIDFLTQLQFKRGYQIASTKIPVNLSDLPSNYPIDKMSAIKDFLKFKLIFSSRKVAGSFNQAYFHIEVYTGKEDLVSINSYVRNKEEIETTIRHELLHMVQSLLNVALEHSYVNKNISQMEYQVTDGYPIVDKSQSGIFRSLSPAAKSFQIGKLKQKDLRQESGSEEVAQLKQILGISPRTMITGDRLQKMKMELTQAENPDTQKIEAVDKLINLIRNTSYFLDEREYHTFIAEAYDNFSSYVRSKDLDFSKEVFNEWIGNPNVTPNTDPFFSSLRQFDFSRWKEAVKQVWKMVEPTISDIEKDFEEEVSLT
jgi:hypothetical protein